MKKIDENAADNIRIRMEGLGLKQTELANLAGIEPESLNKVIRKKRPAGKNMLEALAPHLKCSVADLTGASPTQEAEDLIGVLREKNAEITDLKSQLQKTAEKLQQNETELSRYRALVEASEKEEPGRHERVANALGLQEWYRDQILSRAQKVLEKPRALPKESPKQKLKGR